MSNKIHLVCSAGGMKCLGYIGAFRKLQEHDFEIISVSSCSMGSVLGALLCSGRKTMAELETILSTFVYSRFKKRTVFSFITQFRYPFAKYKTPDFSSIMVELIGEDITLREMKIPFSALVLDVRQDRFLVYSSKTHPDMKISAIIQMATAIPYMYKPYILDRHTLVDAAVATETPVWMAASTLDELPIVVLKPTGDSQQSSKKGYISFLANLFRVTAASHDNFALMQTPRVVEVDIPAVGISPYDFKLSQETIENLFIAGGNAMEKKLDDLEYSFLKTLGVQNLRSIPKLENDTEKAVELANRLMINYQSENSKRNQVFVSYSHKDGHWLRRFQSFLKVLEMYTEIQTWHDGAIEPGDEWREEIQRALAFTKVAVMLVTTNFFTSKFIKDSELQYFLDVTKKENVPIVWIAVSSSPYELTPLQGIQCANDPKNPLDQMDEADQNQEFTRICLTIVEKMKK
jgi:predicted acylesterase/phospholipase RssA